MHREKVVQRDLRRVAHHREPVQILVDRVETHAAHLGASVRKNALLVRGTRVARESGPRTIVSGPGVVTTSGSVMTARMANSVKTPAVDRAGPVGGRVVGTTATVAPRREMGAVVRGMAGAEREDSVVTVGRAHDQMTGAHRAIFVLKGAIDAVHAMFHDETLVPVVETSVGPPLAVGGRVSAAIATGTIAARVVDRAGVLQGLAATGFVAMATADATNAMMVDRFVPVNDGRRLVSPPRELALRVKPRRVPRAD